jgi:GPH family glycoside/pentoside/hexuronide:cation symporter
MPLFTGTPVVACVLFFVASVFGGLGMIASPPMVADTVDYQEMRTGDRNAGLLYSGYSFGTKVGNAIGAALLAGILAWSGYDPDHLTGGARTGISIAFIGVPLLLAVAQGACIAFYNLEDAHEEIVGRLGHRDTPTA